MDAIRVSNVHCTRSGRTMIGTAHLTAHHLIFRFDKYDEEEMWVPYPLIALVTRAPQTLHGLCPIAFFLRTFENFSLALEKESDVVDVFESIKELTVAASVEQLYAFFYSPNPPLTSKGGWSIYSPREEFGRMGVGTRTKAWRFTDINKDYSLSLTYPARLVVPTRISDTTIQYAAKYRSKCRIPALTYLHWANFGSITRASQPMVGITQNRSIQDEKLIEAIFQTHWSPGSRSSSPLVYGATATNLIVDARPTANAVGNTMKGAGTENMDHYADARKVYLGIDNIHTMRDSLAKVVEALREADSLAASLSNEISVQPSPISLLDRQALRRSGWLRHIRAILEGSALIVKNVHVNSSHAFIHCSDGWDRTTQLAAVSQICLDPFYRTIKGFQILVEKDFVSFGHKFLDRCGHLSSEKFFLSPADAAGSGDVAQAFLMSVQNRFASQEHVKETSPVFHQFLESVRQIQRQYPSRFEFNERFLRKIYYHLYSCQFGTFLYNTERERRVGENGERPPCDRTSSVWDFLNSSPEKELNINPTFEPLLDNPKRRDQDSDMGVLFPNTKDVRFWNELYGRSDEEMNGRVSVVGKEKGPQVAREVEPDSGRSGTPSAIPVPPLSKSPSLVTTSLASQVVEVSRSGSPGSGGGKPFPRPESTIIAVIDRPELLETTATPPSSASPKLSKLTTSTQLSPSPSNADLFSSGGVRSIWGKLSSNASAAISSMQEAYVGATRDLNPPSTTIVPSVGEGELQERRTLVSWGEQVSTTPRMPSDSNPWSTVKHYSPVQAPVSENPWNSVKSQPPIPQSAPVLDSYFDRIQLPADPSILQHTPLRNPAFRSRSAATTSSLQSRTDKPSSSNSTDSKRETDPLGVGLS